MAKTECVPPLVPISHKLAPTGMWCWHSEETPEQQVARLDQDWQHGPQVSALPCSCLQLGASLPVGSTQGSVEGLAEVRGRSLPPAEAQVARSLSRLSRQP